MVGRAPAGINIFTYPLVQRGWPQFNWRSVGNANCWCMGLTSLAAGQFAELGQEHTVSKVIKTCCKSLYGFILFYLWKKSHLIKWHLSKESHFSHSLVPLALEAQRKRYTVGVFTEIHLLLCTFKVEEVYSFRLCWRCKKTWRWEQPWLALKLLSTNSSDKELYEWYPQLHRKQQARAPHTDLSILS